MIQIIKLILTLHKDNPSQNKMQLLNDDFIYGKGEKAVQTCLVLHEKVITPQPPTTTTSKVLQALLASVKLKRTWVMQHDNDMKHTSKSNDPNGLKKNKKIKVLA